MIIRNVVWGFFLFLNVVFSYAQNNTFKFRVETNLKDAIEKTKEVNDKFLVVIVDNKKTTEQDFNAFLKNQEKEVAYYIQNDKYDVKYDRFNYYLAGEDDKKWLEKNKITDDPSVVILNGDGEVLASAKSNLSDKKYELSYFANFDNKLLCTDALFSIDKALKNETTSDIDLVNAFNKVSSLNLYDYISTDAKNDPHEFIILKPTLNKEEIAQAWKKLIETHQNDAKPNMYLVEIIVAEIKKSGFTKKIFNEDRILNDTDFLAIDYLLKHSDDIENNRAALNEYQTDPNYYVQKVIPDICDALEQNLILYASQDEEVKQMNKDKLHSVYKKIIASGKADFDFYRNYFYYLYDIEDQDGSKTAFLNEFSAYFDSTLAGTNPVEKLEVIFKGLVANLIYSDSKWDSFKDYNSDNCNTAAWKVVSKPQNSNYIKNAIKWSEYSLQISKNNPYYLDTLAQLYYKDGQKEKAIATETLAVKYLNAYAEEQTASEIKAVLAKMQNGTY